MRHQGPGAQQPGPARPDRPSVALDELVLMRHGAGNRPPGPDARDGVNDGNRHGYQGPCPPIGRHRYYFRLFALDAVLPDLGPDARRAEFERAMEGHVMESVVLMGTYAHPGNG